MDNVYKAYILVAIVLIAFFIVIFGLAIYFPIQDDPILVINDTVDNDTIVVINQTNPDIIIVPNDTKFLHNFSEDTVLE